MSSLTLDALTQKYKALADQDKKTVFDFIDFLSQKRKPEKKKIDRKKLLEVSCWSDEDIKAIEDAGKLINKWQPETF
jgi:hypothetical protein